MAFFDLPLHELQQYKPKREEPADFDQFWQKTLSEARLVDWQPQFVSIDQPLVFVDVFDVIFPGFGGQKIRGWLLIPKDTREPLPCVVEYIGYGGGRGKPMEWLNWVNAGYAHFIMDTRGQGASWRIGDTPDNFTEDERGQFPGFMTRGIQNPQSYYYRGQPGRRPDPRGSWFTAGCVRRPARGTFPLPLPARYPAHQQRSLLRNYKLFKKLS
jgi:cephalosporin-C deacetylase